MKMKTRNLALGVALAAAGLAATPALAAGYCSAGTASEGIAAGNVTFEGAAADDCYGVAAGNVTATTGVTLLNGMNWGTGWAYLDGTDAAGATYMGLAFKVMATPGDSGSWTLAVKDGNGTAGLNLPASLDFAVALKAGDEYALWGFDNVVVDGLDNGVFNILFTNNGGSNADLSHLIVFGRESGGGTISAVPEPRTYAMLLAGLGLIGFAARRKLG